MLRESLNILMYDTATYTHANVEKTANSQVRLDARSDYSVSIHMLWWWCMHGYDAKSRIPFILVVE